MTSPRIVAFMVIVVDEHESQQYAISAHGRLSSEVEFCGTPCDSIVASAARRRMRLARQRPLRTPSEPG
jgi:hypothetical protein